jgi:hypothetical protein
MSQAESQFQTIFMLVRLWLQASAAMYSPRWFRLYRQLLNARVVGYD